MGNGQWRIKNSRRAVVDRAGGIRRGVWRRMGGHRVAIGSAACLIFMLAVSFVTLPWSMQWYNVQELDEAVRHPPSITPVVAFEHYATAGRTPNALESPRGLRVKQRSSLLTAAARVVHRAASWFGHDDLGRSLLFRLWPGFLVSLGIGMAAAAMAVGIGVTWGATAAMAGGRIDLVMMRIVDVLYGLPYILMVILLKLALTPWLTVLLAGHSKYADLVVLLIAIGGVSWLTMARVVRGQVLSLRTEPFVEAARAAGAGPIHIFRWHLLPNLIGPVITYAALVVPQAIMQESFLSFLGIGVQAPMPSLGRLAADGVEAVNSFVGYWWLIALPCGVLVVTLLAMNFIGDSLRDAFDPKSRVGAPAL